MKNGLQLDACRLIRDWEGMENDIADFCSARNITQDRFLLLLALRGIEDRLRERDDMSALIATMLKERFYGSGE